MATANHRPGSYHLPAQIGQHTESADLPGQVVMKVSNRWRTKSRSEMTESRSVDRLRSQSCGLSPTGEDLVNQSTCHRAANGLSKKSAQFNAQFFGLAALSPDKALRTYSLVYGCRKPCSEHDWRVARCFDQSSGIWHRSVCRVSPRGWRPSRIASTTSGASCASRIVLVR
jgi:hypothetical protein